MDSTQGSTRFRVQVCSRSPLKSVDYPKLKALQSMDPAIQKIQQGDADTRKSDFQVAEDGTSRFHGQLCIPDNMELKDEIFLEAYHSNYSIRRGSTKMYQNLC